MTRHPAQKIYGLSLASIGGGILDAASVGPLASGGMVLSVVIDNSNNPSRRSDLVPIGTEGDRLRV